MGRSRISNPEHLRLLASPSWSRCEGLLKAFEEAWRRGPAPAVEDFLHADGPERRALLLELVHADLELRLRAGEPARVETYLRRYPELADDRCATLGLIEAEHELRSRQPGGVGPHEYLQRFPDLLD